MKEEFDNCELGWGFPKGKKNNPRESTLSCAQREVYEETGLLPNMYSVMQNFEYLISYKHAQMNYVAFYFSGIMKVEKELISTSWEIKNAKWVPIKKILRSFAIRDIKENKNINYLSAKEVFKIKLEQEIGIMESGFSLLPGVPNIISKARDSLKKPFFDLHLLNKPPAIINLSYKPPIINIL